MGYEIKLIIGKKSTPTPSYLREDRVELDGDSVYRPYRKDANGELIKSGKYQCYFMVYATLDLCKCGYDSAIHSLSTNANPNDHEIYFYDSGGNLEITEDRYGAKFVDYPIETVLELIKADSKRDDYRRFKWAIALLESMASKSEGLSVILFGH